MHVSHFESFDVLCVCLCVCVCVCLCVCVRVCVCVAPVEPWFSVQCVSVVAQYVAMCVVVRAAACAVVKADF